MLSDEWLKNGYTHGNTIDIIHGLITYEIWTNNSKKPIGVSVNFEYADDVHYNLSYSNWIRFLEDYLNIEHSEDHNRALYNFFSASDCFGFEDSLKECTIPYDKIAFWEPD
ncbi:hypothetical protein [Hungatella effluvii]|uniref:hypothetical protein n=1 Tax=Hungatella effluvii TaxID=1096246 RepID=UPI0022E55A9F|nr:hypothetical protein [Hungatella effluvii]